MSNENPSPPDNRVSQSWAKAGGPLADGDCPDGALT